MPTKPTVSIIFDTTESLTKTFYVQVSGCGVCPIHCSVMGPEPTTASVNGAETIVPEQPNTWKKHGQTSDIHTAGWYRLLVSVDVAPGRVIRTRGDFQMGGVART